MGSGRGLIALAAGLGEGYMGEKARQQKEANDAADRQMRQDDHDLRMQQAQRQEQDRIALADATKPTAVNDGAVTLDQGDGQQHLYEDAGVANSDVRQATRLAEADPQAPAGAPVPTPTVQSTITVNGKQYPDRASADAAAAAYNAPEAQSQRVALALQQRGKPTEAMQYQEQAQKFADQKWEAGLRDAATRGHDGLADYMTQSQGGPFKGKTVKAVPSADGKEVTYNVVNPDGSMTPTPYTMTNDQDGVIQAAYQLSRVDPETRYKHMVEEDKRNDANDLKERELNLKTRELEEVKTPAMEARVSLAGAQASAAEARASAAEARAAAAAKKGEDGVSREERLRYTTLYSESGRRLSDANKTLAKLQSDPLFMRKAATPGTQQANDLQSARDEVTGYKQEREMYQGLLARGGSPAPAAVDSSAPAAGPAPAAAPAAGAASAPLTRKVAPATQTARDAEAGQILMREYGGNVDKARADLAQAETELRSMKNADARGILQEHVNRLRVGINGATASGRASTDTGTKDSPIAVTDKAGRDKLAKGTYYRAPNGQVYIKQ